jgi:Family of unknown function (DUF5317)
MVLALAVVVGLLAGRLLGGRVAAIADLRLRWGWLFYVAIGMQVVAYPSGTLPWSVGDRVATGLWLASYAVAAVAALVNLRIPGVAVMAAGMVCNLAAVVANGGHMPGLPSALRAAGHVYRGVHNNEITAHHAHLAWLIDRWAVPAFIPGGNVYSIGDVLIAAGAIVAVAAAMGARLPGRRQQPVARGLAGAPTTTP